MDVSTKLITKKMAKEMSWKKLHDLVVQFKNLDISNANIETSIHNIEEEIAKRRACPYDFI